PRIHRARRESPARASRRRRARGRRHGGVGAAAAARRHHDGCRLARGRGARARIVPTSRGAWLRLPRAPVHAVLPVGGFSARTPLAPARRVGRQGGADPASFPAPDMIRLRLAVVLVALTAVPAASAGTFGSGRHEGRGYALFTPSAPPAGPLIV